LRPRYQSSRQVARLVVELEGLSSKRISIIETRSSHLTNSGHRAEPSLHPTQRAVQSACKWPGMGILESKPRSERGG